MIEIKNNILQNKKGPAKNTDPWVLVGQYIRKISFNSSFNFFVRS